MTDVEKNTIIAVWNNMVLRNRLELNPYSLTKDELLAMKQNDELGKFVDDAHTFISNRAKNLKWVNV